MTFDPLRKPTREDFADTSPLCTDGAWGTELMKLGGDPGELKDLWNLTAPEKVLRVARSYVEAGSQVILTNTFSSNRIVLSAHGSARLARDVTRVGAEISRRAAGGRAWVFGSVGPTGKMVSLGDLSPEEAQDAFAEQGAALEAGGADAIIIETQADLEEARAALRGCLGATGLPVGVSSTFDSGKDHTRTKMGVTVADAWDLVLCEGASFVGANCGVGFDAHLSVAKLFGEQGRDLPIWIKGNAGRPEPGPGGSPVYRATPDAFARAVDPLLGAGVRFIGGCCGSTPDHIRAVAQVLAGAGPRA